jgi:hypothetical protein
MLYWQVDIQTAEVGVIEPRFLGFTKDEWDLYNGLGTWLSAIGSLAAVIVALYLSSRSTRYKAKVSVTPVTMFSVADGDYVRRFLQFTVVNTGERPFRVEQLGWRSGLFSKHYVVQLFDREQSSPLPVELVHGQKAHWMIPTDAGRSWYQIIAEKLLIESGMWPIATLKATFHTTVGEAFTCRPSGQIRSRLRDALNQNRRGE